MNKKNKPDVNIYQNPLAYCSAIFYNNQNTNFQPIQMTFDNKQRKSCGRTGKQHNNDKGK